MVKAEHLVIIEGVMVAAAVLGFSGWEVIKTRRDLKASREKKAAEAEAEQKAAEQRAAEQADPATKTDGASEPASPPSSDQT